MIFSWAFPIPVGPSWKTFIVKLFCKGLKFEEIKNNENRDDALIQFFFQMAILLKLNWNNLTKN